MSDQCALDANGKLKDASQIDVYESESDTRAIAAKSTGLRRDTRKRDTDKLAQSLAAQKADGDGIHSLAAPKIAHKSSSVEGRSRIASLLPSKTVPSRSKFGKSKTQTGSIRRA
ncbi:hypothetical protein B0H13DRAFT_2329947 [Mycena leptocephala]|nr:hypothetical protein B0H13DRAFT_2329947 [Mycena leptocephala]